MWLNAFLLFDIVSLLTLDAHATSFCVLSQHRNACIGSMVDIDRSWIYKFQRPNSPRKAVESHLLPLMIGQLND